jgi:hypothetical protein
VSHAALDWARSKPRRARLLAVVLAAALVLAACLLPRIAQPLWYHDFADRRPWGMIPNAADVLSNLVFLLAGIAGLWALPRARFHQPHERIPYAAFFTGLALTAFGSAYYHLEPGNGRLFWDRLPITVGFMALTAAVITERISVRAGLRLLPVLLLLGAAGDLHWIWTERAGAGDLRFYGLAHAAGATLPFLILLLFPPRYTRGADFLWAGACYGAAKLTEVLDKPIFAAGHLVSGHTLKHLLAAAAGLVLARMLLRRIPVAAPEMIRTAAR